MTIQTRATAYLYYGAQIYDADPDRADEQWLTKRPTYEYHNVIVEALRDAHLVDVWAGIHRNGDNQVWFVSVGQFYEAEDGKSLPVPVMSLSLPRNSHQIHAALRLLGAPDRVIASYGWCLTSCG